MCKFLQKLDDVWWPRTAVLARWTPSHTEIKEAKSQKLVKIKRIFLYKNKLVFNKLLQDKEYFKVNKFSRLHCILGGCAAMHGLPADCLESAGQELPTREPSRLQAHLCGGQARAREDGHRMRHFCDQPGEDSSTL
jgi:hypothetical protein